MGFASVPRVLRSPAASEQGGVGRNLADMPKKGSALIYAKRIGEACNRAVVEGKKPHELLVEARRHGVREKKEDCLLEALARCMLTGDFVRARSIIEEFQALFDDSLVKGVAENVAMIKYDWEGKEAGLKIARKYGLIALAAKMELDFVEPSENGKGEKKPDEGAGKTEKVELGLLDSIGEVEVILPWEKKAG